MKEVKLTKGTVINNKYRILDFCRDTYFGDLYSAFCIDEEIYMDLYQLNDNVNYSNDISEFRNADYFDYDNERYIVVKSEPYDMSKVRDKLDEANEIFRKGCKKKKGKLRLKGADMLIKVYKENRELFLSDLESVNNLAFEYLNYYYEDVNESISEKFLKDHYFEDAFNLYMESALRNSPKGQFMLAKCYENALGCKCNYTLAAKWYMEALDRGYKNAHRYLAYFYDRGLGVEQNEEKAFYHYSHCYENNPNACMEMSKRYFDGIGVQQSDELGFMYLNKAKEYGGKSCYLNLAKCYMDGVAVEKDMKASEKHLRKAIRYRVNVKKYLRKRYLNPDLSSGHRAKGWFYMVLSYYLEIAFSISIIGILIALVVLIELFF